MTLKEFFDFINYEKQLSENDISNMNDTSKFFSCGSSKWNKRKYLKESIISLCAICPLEIDCQCSYGTTEYFNLVHNKYLEIKRIEKNLGQW